MYRRYHVDEKAFSLWSADIAYVLGYIYADGHLQDVPSIRAQYLRVTSIDRDRLIFIRDTLKSSHLIVEVPKKQHNYKDKFLLSIGSKVIYKDLLRIGLHPAKSMNMTMPKVPQKYFHHFVRGYFDGDGCVFIERRPSKNGARINIRRLSVTFTSGSMRFLESLGSMLVKLNCVDRTKIYKNGNSFQMRFSTSEALMLYDFMYKAVSLNAYMKRKKNTFEEYKQIRKLPK